MSTPRYVPLPGYETARCSECGGVTVLLDGHRIAPLWRDTQTGRILCDSCKTEKEQSGPR